MSDSREAMKRRLVRARPKAVEYLPEWARCCPEAIAVIAKFGIHEVDPATSLMAPAGLDACTFCGSEVPSVRIAKAKCGCWFPIDLFDLDEGIEP